MGKEMEIFIAGIEDAEEIAKLAAQTWTLHQKMMLNYLKPMTLEDNFNFIASAINGQDSEVFEAIINGKVCGYLALYLSNQPADFFVYPQCGVIASIGVDESYRDKGIGTALVRAAEDYCKARGVGALDIDVFVFNEKAEKLYNKLGYRELKHYRRKILL